MINYKDLFFINLIHIHIFIEKKLCILCISNNITVLKFSGMLYLFAKFLCQDLIKCITLDEKLLL